MVIDQQLVEKKDFDQALIELGLKKKDWLRKHNIGYEWLRRNLQGAGSPKIQKAIADTVKEAERKRKKRHQKRKNKKQHG